jgi:hypothetical protein
MSTGTSRWVEGLECNLGDRARFKKFARDET